MDLEESDDEGATWSTGEVSDDESEAGAGSTRLAFRPLWRFSLARHLPYAECLESEAVDNLRVIKHALARAYLLRDVTRLHISLDRLNDYLLLYGTFMSREDYVLLIQLLLKCILRSPTDYRNIEKCCYITQRLMKHAYRYVDRKDLEIDWKPLFDLYHSLDHHPFRMTKHYHLNSSTKKSLKNVIRICRSFFSVSATAEILELLLPELCPLDTACRTVLDRLEVFLPVDLSPRDHQHCWQLWQSKLLDLVSLMNNTSSWDHSWYCLMGRLGWYNVGHVVWTDQVRTIVFSRLLRSFGLPIGFCRAAVYPANKKNVVPLTCWVVSMLGGSESAIDYLERLLEAVVSYFYPSNSGPWQEVLGLFLYALCRLFTSRLNRERHRRSVWIFNTLESHRISDMDVERFVRAILPCVMQGIYWSHFRGKEKVCRCVEYLSNLRADLVVDPIIESLYKSVSTVTEPLRLTCGMTALSCVLRCSVLLGRTHLLFPLLEQLIPAIDINDEVKTSCFLQLMAQFADIVTFVDCSSCCDHPDLTEEQRLACALTAGSESLLLQLLDRLLSLIEALSVDTIRHGELAAPAGLSQIRSCSGGTVYGHLESAEVMALDALCKLTARVLAKTDVSNQRLVAERVRRFISGCGCLDGRLSGRMAATLCCSVVAANSELGVELLVSPTIARILQVVEEQEDTGSQERRDDDPDTRLMFHLLLLKEMCGQCGGDLLTVSDRLELVLRRCCHLPQRAVTDLCAELLSEILTSLLAVYMTSYGDWSARIADKESLHLLVKEWGECSDWRSLRIKWHVCSETELSWATRLVSQFVIRELDCVEQYVNNTKQLNKEELLCSLRLILLGMWGASMSLPPIESPLSSTIEKHAVEQVPLRVEAGCVVLPLKFCLRQRIVELMSALIKYQLQHHPDDVYTLKAIIAIMDGSMTEYEERIPISRSLRPTRPKLNHLDLHVGPKRLSEYSLTECLMDYHRLRLSMRFNVSSSVILCERVMPDLLTLSVHDYTQVRTSAQFLLSDCTEIAFNSWEALWPRVVKMLRSGNLSHEQLKGLLHVISKGINPLVMRNSWQLKCSLWPTLLLCTDSEKESIARLIEKLPRGVYYYVEAPLQHQFLSCGDALAEKLSVSDTAQVTEQERQTAEKGLIDSASENLKLYHQLITELLELFQSGKLHWRRNQLALDMIAMLVRPDVPPSSLLIQTLLNSLVHSSIVIRKETSCLLLAVLKQLKPVHSLAVIDDVSCVRHRPVHASLQRGPEGPTWRHWPLFGEREDNVWLQYDSGTAPTTCRQWGEPRFVHKMKWGYNQWSRPLRCVYRQLDDWPPEDDSAAKLAVLTFLTSESCLQKMVHYMSMEENKGQDVFQYSNACLFKSLARNHGVKVLDALLPHLQTLAADVAESSQKCAAEIFCGLVRGSKHWPFASVERLWLCLIPILNTCLAHVHKYSASTWIACINRCVGDRDPNRLHWLMEALLKSVFCPEDVLFVTCVKLDILLFVCGELEWRGAEFKHRVLDLLSTHLDHPYQSVRRKIGSVLAKVFSAEIYRGPFTFGPNSSNFLDLHLPKLDVLLALNSTPDTVETCGSPVYVSPSSDEACLNTIREKANSAAYKLLQTLSQYISASVAGRLAVFVSPVHVRLVPVLCAIESYDTDRHLQTDCVRTLHLLSSQFFGDETMAALLQQLRRVMAHQYWRVQMAGLRLLQAVTFHNMFLLTEQAKICAEVIELVLAALSCARLEVRQLASQVLSGLFHCHFIGVDQRRHLVSRFSSEASAPLVARVSPEYGAGLVRRHCAVLGLCAVVAAAPYHIPDHLPAVLTTLSYHARDPPPIQETIRTTINNFKRTHYENWSEHSRHFTSEQLCNLTDMTVSPNYFI